VLAHDTLQEFAARAADKKIYTLSMKGLDEVAQFMARRLGLALILDESEFSEMRKLIALRNLITHRRGKIDRRYIESVSDSSLKLGNRIQVDHEAFLASWQLVARLAYDLASRAIAKFGLPASSGSEKSVQLLLKTAEGLLKAFGAVKGQPRAR